MSQQGETPEEAGSANNAEACEACGEPGFTFTVSTVFGNMEMCATCRYVSLHPAERLDEPRVLAVPALSHPKHEGWTKMLCRHCGQGIRRPSLSPLKTLWLTFEEMAGKILRSCPHEPKAS